MMRAVLVNGAAIEAESIAAEMQFHPARSREEAWHAAATALGACTSIFFFRQCQASVRYIEPVST